MVSCLKKSVAVKKKYLTTNDLYAIIPKVKENALTGRFLMDALELVLLLDYYGGMLTDKQKECFDMRYNQDMSLGEIAEMLGISRQAVNDSLTRTETLLRRMEENIGCVKRDLKNRSAVQEILAAVAALDNSSDPAVLASAGRIRTAVQSIKE